MENEQFAFQQDVDFAILAIINERVRYLTKDADRKVEEFRKLAEREEKISKDEWIDKHVSQRIAMYRETNRLFVNRLREAETFAEIQEILTMRDQGEFQKKAAKNLGAIIDQEKLMDLLSQIDKLAAFEDE